MRRGREATVGPRRPDWRRPTRGPVCGRRHAAGRPVAACAASDTVSCTSPAGRERPARRGSRGSRVHRPGRSARRRRSWPAPGRRRRRRCRVRAGPWPVVVRVLVAGAGRRVRPRESGRPAPARRQPDAGGVAQRAAQPARAAGATASATTATSTPIRLSRSLTIRVYRRRVRPCLYCVDGRCLRRRTGERRGTRSHRRPRREPSRLPELPGAAARPARPRRGRAAGRLRPDRGPPGS